MGTDAMELDYWQFDESPFPEGVEADWFYPSVAHDESLARIFYLIEQVQPSGLLTGPTGSGKSHLLAVVRRQSSRTQRRTVSVDAFGASGEELLRGIAEELRLGPVIDSLSLADRWRAVSDCLRGLKLAGIQTVILVDHLCAASPDCVTVLRRLLHVTRGGTGPAAIGPDWLTVLPAVTSGSAMHRALVNSGWNGLRIEVRPLTQSETEDYLTSRLKRVGGRGDLFSAPAAKFLHARSGGSPRELHRIARLCLLAAMSEGRDRITPDIVEDVVSELTVEELSTASSWNRELAQGS